ncbi:phosphoglycerate mutase family protein [Haliangium sp.]|uniref:phosphoglycerate mutase family protein n=1 Tax=Haliangium sp. TaxID=2663208 RepID=UPI003D0A06F5
MGLVLLAALVQAACATSVTTVYVVRHAEKQGGEDPELTAAGHARAQELARMLDGVPVSAVYSTDTKRTRQTAQPLAAAKGLSVQPYAAPTDVRELAAAHKGQVVVVVGHSNTVPAIIDALGGQAPFELIPDTQFDHLFLLVVSQGGGSSSQVQVLHMRYGPATP